MKVPNLCVLVLSLPIALAAHPALADGDAAAGRTVYNKCRACHSLEAGKNGLGPSFAGLFGRPAGTVDGFAYSDAMQSSSIVWSEDTIAAFLTNPKEYIPGTSKSFPGMPNEQELANLIAYLKEASQ